MAWFHTHYAKVDTNKTFEIEQMFASMADVAPKAPRRMRITQYYSKHYYNTRIKPVFEAEWALRGEATSRINLLNSVTSRLWNSEPEAFKTLLENQRNKEHEKEVEAHQKLVKELESLPDSPESYHR